MWFYGGNIEKKWKMVCFTSKKLYKNKLSQVKNIFELKRKAYKNMMANRGRHQDKCDTYLWITIKKRKSFPCYIHEIVWDKKERVNDWKFQPSYLILSPPTSCLVKDFEQRPRAKELLSHPFIQGVPDDTAGLRRQLTELTSDMEPHVTAPYVTTKHGQFKSKRKTGKAASSAAATLDNLAMLEVMDEVSMRQAVCW